MWYWLFLKEKSNHFIVLSEHQLEEEGRWVLEDDGYSLILDSARDIEEAAKYAKEYLGAKKVKLEVIPVTLKEASRFVNNHHRHHIAPQGHKFSVGITDGENLVGVVIAGRPVARNNDDGLTLEITRCCTKSVYKNGVSRLYSSVSKVAKAMGYKKIITYTLASERGVSLKASGFKMVRKLKGRSWNSENRKRVDRHPTEDKILWLREIG